MRAVFVRLGIWFEARAVMARLKPGQAKPSLYAGPMRWNGAQHAAPLQH
jgi:hypothetical protein